MSAAQTVVQHDTYSKATLSQTEPRFKIELVKYYPIKINEFVVACYSGLQPVINCHQSNRRSCNESSLLSSNEPLIILKHIKNLVYRALISINTIYAESCAFLLPAFLFNSHSLLTNHNERRYLTVFYFEK